MLARNPNTGGEIRVIKLDTSIWKNKKTLVWMKDGPETYGADARLWQRVDIAVVGVSKKLMAWSPQIVILTEDTPEVQAWLSTQAARDTRFILISSKVVESIGEDKFESFQLGNVMCLEEFNTMYPFLGSEWDGSAEDALISAAVVFRYMRVVGIKAGHTRLGQILIDKVSITLEESSPPPEPLVLIQQYYTPANKIRSKELYKCLKANIENPLIDRIVLFVESKSDLLPPDPNKKVTKVLMKSRITYADCIETVQKQIGPGHLVVFANTDIYLDATWRSVWAVDLRDTFAALLRWEEGEGATEATPFGPRNDSQDSWLIHSDSVLSRTWDLEKFKIPFGKAGCDNAILTEFMRNKFKIVNPAFSLRTIHVHKSEYRTYDKTNIVDTPVYVFIEPSGIHELNPITSWDSWTTGLVAHKPLDRPLKATNNKMLGIFCSQMNRDPSFVWSVDGTNAYNAPANQDHIIDISGGAFVSPSGLVYKHTNLYVGNTETQKKIWSENKISHLMPAQLTPAMMCFPLETDWLTQPSLYTLYYLSKVVKQHVLTPEASFWCKKSDLLLPSFRLFKWKEPRGHLIEFNEQSQAFAKKVVGNTSHTVRIMPADVDALRSAFFGGWKEVPSDDNVLAIIGDTVHLTDKLLRALAEAAQEADLTVRVVLPGADAACFAEALNGASRVIVSTSAKTIKTPTWAWSWLTPKGCKILELQEDREPSDGLLHLCAAGGMEWTLLQYPRSTPDGFRKIIMTEFGKWLAAGSTSSATLPVVIVPPKTMKFGFFGHKGDSFRELVDMWAEKGYIESKEDPAAVQCWLGGIGRTLLYDRPTWSWLEKAPEAEQTYKVCLAGNPDPSEKTDAKPWIFWPRQPRLVERLAATLKGPEERHDSLVFFGRVENDTQGKYRQDISGWASLCSKFSMPIGAKEPYLYGPEEYLLALQGSKYGLCLRGFGPKCNREIELLAMGTVPVVTPGVDITNYAEPLLDGIHVLCVTDPADAKKKMAAISDTQWETMSKAGHMWWKRNASAEGSWLKTKSLLTPLN